MNYKLLFKDIHPNHPKHHHVILAGAMFAITALAFSVGLLYGENDFTNAGGGAGGLRAPTVRVTGLNSAAAVKDVSFNLFWDVWKKVKSQYVGQPVSDSSLFYGALQGLASAVNDPYTVFMPVQQASRFAQDLSGSFSGIGAELGMKKEIITIIAPLSGSPAEKAGLKAGDYILEIDGTSTAGLNLDQAVDKIRGPQGTPVRLKILSDGSSAPKDVRIVRDNIKIESVTWQMKDNNTAYIKITNFNDDTSDKFDQAVGQILAKNPLSLILDLRNNPGGYLESAVSIGSEWIAGNAQVDKNVAKGVVVRERSSSGKEETYVSTGQHRLANLKTIVLVNEGSASAAEILAGALQDYSKAIRKPINATIIGTKTFGKGSVQTYEQLSDGSGLKITIAKWLTPVGREIDKVGIAPDKQVEPLTAALKEELAKEEKAQEQIAAQAAQKDVVLDEAMRLAR